MHTPLQIAICEDSLTDVALLASYIKNSDIAACLEVFSSGEMLLAAFAPGKYNLIFLDIYMSGMRGVDAAAEIRKLDRTVMLAFTTTSIEHTLESYRLKAAGYLEKPVKREDVQEVLSLAWAKRNTAAYITLLIGGENKMLAIESIVYFELQNHAITVYTQAETLRISQTVKLSHIEPMLPAHFLRCHHSYIVNLHYVKGIDKALSIFIMQDNSFVHIRRRDLPKVIKSYENALFLAARRGGV